MLNRRILRIKAFKVVYSRVENSAMTLKEAEAELERSCEATRDLYLYLLAVAGPLTGEALSRIEAARSKFNPTEEELHPNMKFVRNAVAPLFENDPDFNRIIKKKKLSWENNDVFLRHLYESVREKDWFKLPHLRRGVPGQQGTGRHTGRPVHLLERRTGLRPVMVLPHNGLHRCRTPMDPP